MKIKIDPAEVQLVVERPEENRTSRTASLHGVEVKIDYLHFVYWHRKKIEAETGRRPGLKEYVHPHRPPSEIREYAAGLIRDRVDAMSAHARLEFFRLTARNKSAAAPNLRETSGGADGTLRSPENHG